MSDTATPSVTPSPDFAVDWHQTYAAIWRSHGCYLRPVSKTDPIGLAQLLNIDRQKQRLCANTERFLRGEPANNALLWGARGTGKSSLIKALLNHYTAQGLRLIQMDKGDLHWLPELADSLCEQPYRFIIFIDDLSFESGDSSYKALKSMLEGSIEVPPDNVLFYATSNRRHLLPESMQDNLDSGLVEGELHYADAVEEKISLSDRFGLWLSFYAISQAEYLAIIDSYFPGHPDPSALHGEAIRFAMTKGARSGRTAQQFYRHYQPGQTA